MREDKEMTTMTTSNLYVPASLVSTSRSSLVNTSRSPLARPAPSAPKAATTVQPNVINPFARRPLGAPLPVRERVGVLAVLAVLAALIGTALVRADRASLERSSSSAVEGALTR
jgi:hypothetical protein